MYQLLFQEFPVLDDLTNEIVLKKDLPLSIAEEVNNLLANCLQIDKNKRIS